ncbi:MAG: hypothetical protein VYA80_00415 [Pseudomonadota bacterium]|nr:hypothetical protein [Pseudomonadota bacterium]
MTDSNTLNWKIETDRLNLDAEDVKKVSKRYDMYKNYTEKETGEYLSLERWYHWYRIEKLSEGHAAQSPPEQGCSIDQDTSNTKEIVSAADFLAVLKLYRSG